MECVAYTDSSTTTTKNSQISIVPNLGQAFIIDTNMELENVVGRREARARHGNRTAVGLVWSRVSLLHGHSHCSS